MATPVVTDKWAGQFDCSVCRRKRLTAEEFSKTALEKYRSAAAAPLKCKRCVGQALQGEQEAAAHRRDTAGDDVAQTSILEERVCASCSSNLGANEYNRNQWSKGVGKSRCRACVEKAIADDELMVKESKQKVLDNARKALANARATGNAPAIVQAESVLSALEAEQVTGLKPVKMGGRGRGRAGRGGQGRGR
jgi:hypothetical protein